MAKQFDMELFFQALGDRTRLRLLNLMREDEICVCFFVEVFKTNQPKISRHLAYLRNAGLMSARREKMDSLPNRKACRQECSESSGGYTGLDC